MSRDMLAPFVALEETEQARDIRGGLAPSDIWRGYARVKEYVKLKREGVDWLTAHPREREFDQPYQVASAHTGMHWGITNRVYSGALVGCNLGCPYCFCDQQATATLQVGARQYVDDYRAFNDDLTSPYAGVLRYSGGEPMLHQAWLHESLCYALTQAGVGLREYVWIDTNLTINPGPELRTLMRNVQHCAPQSVGVCGCFKPGVDGADLEEQLYVANQWIKAGADMYFYWPSWGGEDADLIPFLEQLADISGFAPLRLTVIKINWDYAAMQDRRGMVDAEQAEAQFQVRRSLWAEWCRERYGPELLWLPSHRVPLL